MIINTNVMALNAQRNLASTNIRLGRALEKLSSGLRINRAADDAAGLAISEKMRSQIRGMRQGSRNAQDGISMIQTAEGAMSEVHELLQRMRELSVQAGNSTLSTQDRTSIGTEIQALKTEIDNIANRVTFNGLSLLTGTLAVSTASDRTSSAPPPVSSALPSMSQGPARHHVQHHLQRRRRDHADQRHHARAQTLSVAIPPPAASQVLDFNALG
jgi:flagellin-like hook-associated protein FlgL